MLVTRAELHVRIGAEPKLVTVCLRAKRAATALLTVWMGELEQGLAHQPVNNAGQAIQSWNPP
jgi:hypothetical protein